jgi:hypothetical protein
MIPTLMLAMALGPEVSPGEIERLNHTFERAREVRVVTFERAFFVRSPRAIDSGLDYRVAPGFAVRRPSIVAGGSDLALPPPRPVPWSTIERIEWTHGGAAAGWIAGMAGAGVVLGGAVLAITRSHSDVGPSAPSVLLGAAAGGALIGVFVADAAKKTEIVYPRPARNP